MTRTTSISVFLALSAFTFALHAQTPTSPPPPAAPCSTAEYRQFDFWVGDWDVTTPDGKLAGHSRVDKILNGCVLHENWKGAGGGNNEGQSFNIYDASRKVWHQTWVDRSGGMLVLEGGLKDGSMVLEGKRVTAAGEVLNRITWTPRDDGSVTQTWVSSKDQGQTWQTQFPGVYTRVKPAKAAQKRHPQ